MLYCSRVQSNDMEEESCTVCVEESIVLIWGRNVYCIGESIDLICGRKGSGGGRLEWESPLS